MWYRFSQQAQPLDLTKSQPIPSGGELEITLANGDLQMGPNDEPKLVSVTDDNGAQKNIILLHGTPDGMLVFPGESGQLQAGTVEQFNEWKRKKGWSGYPHVSCYGSKIVGSSGSDALINAAGTVSVGKKTLPDGTEKIFFRQ